MKLVEVFQEIRNIYSAASAHQNTCSQISSSDLAGNKISSEQILALHKALEDYVKLTEKSEDPFIKKSLDFLKEILNRNLKSKLALEFMDKLLTIPLEHEEKLNTLREEIAIDYQKNWEPLEDYADSQVMELREDSDRKIMSLPVEVANPSATRLRELKKPSFEEIRDLNGEMVFEIPIDSVLHPNGLKVRKYEDAAIDPKHELIRNRLGEFFETDFLAAYKVRWDRTKVIRDLYQNFLDAHGQTLEGIRIVIRKEGDQYIVRVEGLGEFNPEYIEKVGASDKQDNDEAAGEYGEGTLILSLILLRDFNADDIAFASRNWQVSYKIDKTASGKSGFLRKLDLVNDRRGNFLELKTKDPSLVNALVQGVGLAYHPYHTDFHNPTYENKHGGFKYLGKNGRGNIYLTRQRYQVKSEADKDSTRINEVLHGHLTSSGGRVTPVKFEGNTMAPGTKTIKDGPGWNNSLEQFNIWTKRRIPGWNSDRDRSALSEPDIKKALEFIIQEMTDNDLLSMIKNFEEYWYRDINYYIPGLSGTSMINIASHFLSEQGETKKNMDRNATSTVATVLKLLIKETKTRGIIVRFPDNLVAMPPESKMSKKNLEDMQNNGYKFCMPELAEIGMQEAKDLLSKLTKKTALKPALNEIKQINILKKAARLLEKEFLNKSFAPIIMEQDIDKPIYIFDRHSMKFKDNAIATYAGNKIWMDRQYLGACSFKRALSTYLHELTHKHGKDESAEFSYKITDWLEIVMEGFDDNRLREQLGDLQRLWEEIVPEEKIIYSEIEKRGVSKTELWKDIIKKGSIGRGPPKKLTFSEEMDQLGKKLKDLMKGKYENEDLYRLIPAHLRTLKLKALMQGSMDEYNKTYDEVLRIALEIRGKGFRDKLEQKIKEARNEFGYDGLDAALGGSNDE